ncbi:MAG: Panacea domain-containing protein [Candidatus Korarchaeota archaeon]|nr:Panacea domain-containing protein [Candidatus Korarchaeota archaeon]
MRDGLRRLLLWIVREYETRYRRGITVTRLMKLLYMVDLELRRRGLPTSGVRWVRWYYGPFSREVMSGIDELIEEGELKREAVVRGDKIIGVLSSESGARLEPEVEAVARRVVGELGGLKFERLLDRVYATFDEDKDLGDEVP